MKSLQLLKYKVDDLLSKLEDPEFNLNAAYYHYQDLKHELNLCFKQLNYVRNTVHQHSLLMDRTTVELNRQALSALEGNDESLTKYILNIQTKIAKNNFTESYNSELFEIEQIIKKAEVTVEAKLLVIKLSLGILNSQQEINRARLQLLSMLHDITKQLTNTSNDLKLNKEHFLLNQVYTLMEELTDYWKLYDSSKAPS